MTTKEQVFFDSDKGIYKITSRNAKGDEVTRDTVATIKPMDEKDAVGYFLGLAKDAPTKRNAAVTLIGLIMKAGMGKIEGWKGSCDKTKGLPRELKSAMQEAEGDYFRQFLSGSHPQHKSFMGRLPKANDRGEPLEVGGKLNQEAQFQYFLTTVRKEPSYANAKNGCLNFFGYVGSLPYTDTGDIVPPEVMRVLVEQNRDITPPDTSYKARVYALYREVVAESKNPPDSDLMEIHKTLQELADHFKTLKDAAAQRATMKPGDVVAQTKDAMAKAGKQVAAGPGINVAKAQEPAPL